MTANKACCWILTILAGGFILTMLIVAWGVGQAVSSFGSVQFQSGRVLEHDSWLQLDIQGAPDDYHSEPSIPIIGKESGPTLHHMLLAVARAKEEDHIKGIVLRPMGSLGFASLRELREKLLDFKSSGKPIYAHMDVGTDRDYYLASVADTIIMMPGRQGGLVFTGLGIHSTYLKSTFEKVGIKFHVLHEGRYKGAYEDLARDSMSADLRESITTLYTDVYESYTHEIAKARRGLTWESLNDELMNGKQYLVTPSACLAKGYVDKLEDWTEFTDRLKGDEEKFEAVGPRVLIRATPKAVDDKKRIAVLYAQGEISHGGEGGIMGDGGIEAVSMIETLEKLRNDDDVAAVVLRVNSPGGSALASKMILESVKRLKADKPVVVSIGRLAASGGYYISLAADKIIAQPSTVTGSIGVVAMFPTAEELYRKIGARGETISVGKWANYFRIDKDLNEEQIQVLTTLMDSVYYDFKNDVSEGRGLAFSSLDTIAEGRVWTGNQALARGLVDELGGLDEAIKAAAEKANLAEGEYRVSYYPKEKDIFQYIVDNFLTSVGKLNSMADKLEALTDPDKLVALLDRFYNKLGFLQTVLPIQTNL